MSKKSIREARYRAAISALRERRIVLRLSQSELAIMLSRSQQFVSKYESFERRLDIVEFIDVAEALTMDWLGLLERLERTAERNIDHPATDS